MRPPKGSKVGERVNLEGLDISKQAPEKDVNGKKDNSAVRADCVRSAFAAGCVLCSGTFPVPVRVVLRGRFARRAASRICRLPLF